jgi:hypothetical protein
VVDEETACLSTDGVARPDSLDSYQVIEKGPLAGAAAVNLFGTCPGGLPPDPRHFARYASSMNMQSKPRRVRPEVVRAAATSYCLAERREASGGEG